LIISYLIPIYILTDVFGGERFTAITPDVVERHQASRMARRKTRCGPPRPATINRQLGCLKTMFNLAGKDMFHLPGGVPAQNRIQAVKFLAEKNVRYRLSSVEEIQRLWDSPPDFLKLILFCAYSPGILLRLVDSGRPCTACRWCSTDKAPVGETR
jgi:hypothetical protein